MIHRVSKHCVLRGIRPTKTGDTWQDTYTPQAHPVARVLARWQSCSGNVQDDCNAGEDFLCAGRCSSVTSVQPAFLRKYGKAPPGHL
ncbi:hypothetical protein AVEN_187106-1 [Araneus ventricosus]|uniref:Uncharacterized protein n=1 Tax=Araneus ventricosus TaxID=182803 RepID=A0A4Y2EUL5_ARAVE|nr:hypothetical protein AVEN_187106-1 [Araneus ventricosus]